MGIKSSFDKPTTGASLVDKQIGTSYDVVETVHDNLDAIIQSFESIEVNAAYVERAETAAIASETSSNNSADSANEAATYATNSATSASNSASSASNAATSASNASSSASTASTKASESAGSASASASSASSASGSATSAANSASSATTQASNAATSASQAATSASNAASSASSANTSANTATTKAGEAATSASNSAASATASAGSASSAASSASAASTSASSASTSASNAASSASNAASSASAASTSASNAAGSVVAAQTLIDDFEQNVGAIGTASTYDAQTTLTDTTPDSLMKVGAFGVGIGGSITGPTIGNFDTEKSSGLYRTVGGETGSPQSTGIGSVLNMRTSNINQNSQLMIRGALPSQGNTVNAYIRGSGSTEQGTWRELYHTGNLTLQASLNDTTTNALMKVGAFGLGATFSTKLYSNLSAIATSNITEHVVVDGTSFGTPVTDRPAGVLSKGGTNDRWSFIGVTDKGNLRGFIQNSGSGSPEELYHTGNSINASDYGVGTALLLTNTVNLDTLKSTAFYFNNTASNTTGNNYPMSVAGSLQVIAYSTTLVTQEYTAYSGTGSLTNKKFFRSWGASGWSTWSEMYHTGNFDPDDYALRSDMLQAIGDESNEIYTNLGTAIATKADASHIHANATETTAGFVELANNAEALAGTDTSRVMTPNGVKQYVDSKVSAPTAVVGYQVSTTYYQADFNNASGSAGVKLLLSNLVSNGSSNDESFGPTGSGATNIWPLLDVMPANTLYLRVLCSLSVGKGTYSGNQLSTKYTFYKGVQGSSYSTAAELTVENIDANDGYAMTYEINIPLGTGKIFYVQRNDNTNLLSSGCTLTLLGFGV